MSCHFFRRALFAAAAIGAGLWSVSFGLPEISRAADDSSAESLLNEQLAAGEFAPAIKNAENAPGPQRDRWLSSIAQAQAGIGEKSGSLSTASQIRDDTFRSQTLGNLGRQPPPGAQGGAGNADFQSLIELITTTIAPTSWDEVGGPGAIQEYRNGVYVNAQGVVKRIEQEGRTENRLTELRRTAERALGGGDVREESQLRKISLPRLEREIQLRLAAGLPLDDEMQVLAGLQRIKYVLIYPETGDVVLAGPAGDWRLDRENRLVSASGGRPVVRLEDLVLLLRHVYNSPDGEFGCSIDPTEDGLAKVQAFLAESSKKPIKASARGKWLEQLRSQLGLQTIKVFGIDPASRVASTIVEADYRMKLVGIGLEEGTLDVPSYLEMVRVPPGQAPPPMNVLRWWFTVNYDAVRTTADRDAYELSGQGVKVLSENELLAANGKQVHTGTSDELTSAFAHNFTKHFAALAAKYPVYAELQNIFDLALAASLIKAEGLADRAGWRMTAFNDPRQFALARGPAPQTVDTVINHRVVNRVHVLAAVSGGVSADCRSLVKAGAIQVDKQGTLASQHGHSQREQASQANWWWD